MRPSSGERSTASREAARSVLIPVIVGLLLGLIVVLLTRGGGERAGEDLPAVGPARDAARLPVALPEGVDASEVEVVLVPPPETQR